MKAIIAVNNLGFIGKGDKLLWHNKKDLNHFKYIKRLLKRYKISGELKTHLILNHFIILYNIFGEVNKQYGIGSGAVLTCATFIFYIIHAVTDGYIYLFLLVLFMLVLSWMLLLTKLHDLSLRHHQTTKQFMLTNFGLPIIGTFYSFIKLTQK